MDYRYNKNGDYTKEQITDMIYAYMVEGQRAAYVCKYILNMDEKQIGNTRQAWRRLEKYYYSYGFVKKYTLGSQSAFRNIEKNKLRRYVELYWDKRAKESDLIDFFPEIKADLDAAKREDKESGTLQSSKGTSTTKRKTNGNNAYLWKKPKETIYDDDDTDYDDVDYDYEDYDDDYEDYDDIDDFYEDDVNITDTTAGQYHSANLNSSNNVRYGKKESYNNRNNSNVGINNNIKSNSRIRTNNNVKSKDNNIKDSNFLYDEKPASSSGQNNGDILGFIGLAVVVIILWKVGFFSLLGHGIVGIFGNIFWILELLFFYGGIILLIVSLIKGTFRGVWKVGIGMMITGFGFGFLSGGDILIGIICLVIGLMILFSN